MSAPPSDVARRRLLFWCGCLPTRLAIAAAAWALGRAHPRVALPLLGLYAALTSLSFAVNVVRARAGTKTRGGLGGVVWWAEARYVHVLTYAAVAALAWAARDADAAAAVLVADVAFGAAVAVVQTFWRGVDG
jgi:hypothetical protein